MGQPDTSNSNTPQGPLHPLLQSALGCLEVQLDDELTRYRRQRSAQPSSNRPFKSNIRTKKKHTLDLISVKPSTNPPSPNNPTHPNHSASDQPPTTGATSHSASAAYNGATNGASNGHAHNGQAHNGHTYNGGPASNGTSSAIATLNVAQSPHAIAGMNSAQGSQGAIANPSPTAPPHGNLAPVTDPNRLNAGDPAEPQDYLASSEHLLQSLVDEAQTAEHPPKRSWTSQLLTPLGIGSLLLLLVSSVGLGYVIANPDALSNISARWQTDDDAANPNLDEPVTPNASEFDPSGQPNLSSEEFVELDLGTLSTLPSNAPNTAPAPSLAPAPGLAANGSTPPAPLAAPVTPSTTANGSAETTSPSTSPSAAPSTSSAASSSAASRSPAPAAPSSQSSSSTSSSSSASRSAAPAPPRPAASTSTQAAASSGSSGSGAGANRPPASNSTGSSGSETAASAAGSASSGDYYHVVIPYTGDQSLNEARQVASDAYIHNSSSGATIRLGAFTDQASAQEMVQNLEAQGLDANIED